MKQKHNLNKIMHQSTQSKTTIQNVDLIKASEDFYNNIGHPATDSSNVKTSDRQSKKTSAPSARRRRGKSSRYTNKAIGGGAVTP